MADTSATALILFIAAVAVAAGVAGIITGTVGDISDAIDIRGDQITEEVRSDITILGDPGSEAIYTEDASGNGTITVYVKNTGAEPLTTRSDHITVLIDGTYEPISQLIDPSSGDTLTQWKPGEIAKLQIERTLTAGQDYRVLINIQGSEDTAIIYLKPSGSMDGTGGSIDTSIVT